MSDGQARAPVLSSTPGHLIRRAQQVHTALWGMQFDGELTGPQYAVVVALAIETLATQKRLGELASLDKNTVTDMVRRLEDRGWIERIADDDDRRRRRLVLSDGARAALRETTPKAEIVQRRLLAPISPRERIPFVKRLARVAYQGGVMPAKSKLHDVPILHLAMTPGYLIRRTERLHTSTWTSVVGSVLTPPQYAILTVLSQRPAIDQATLGALASLDKSSTADIVARLTRAGWLLCPARKEGGRRASLHVAARARAALRRIDPLVTDVQRRLLAPLRGDERDAFARGLALVAYRGDVPHDDAPDAAVTRARPKSARHLAIGTTS